MRTHRQTPGDPVDRILEAHRITGPWERLTSTGVANRVYATRDVVLRVATDHLDAVVDARTESVAAPVARAAGVLTPRLIAFDDSRTIVDRPFSLWERVHGETLGDWKLGAEARREVWREAGEQLARLHEGVRSCPDPDGYLEDTRRELRLDRVVRRFADCGRGSTELVREIERLIVELTPFVSRRSAPDCFVHNDLHEWNLLCGSEGGLLAAIDWGDAGWGDPTLDFAAVPLECLAAALEGYGRRELLGEQPEARFVWDRLHNALEDAIDDPARGVPVAEYRGLLEGRGWRV
jgi:aminoglycoside phosphotransferase (APT) family kinase protein